MSHEGVRDDDLCILTAISGPAPRPAQPDQRCLPVLGVARGHEDCDVLYIIDIIQ